jgi:glutamate racemase
MKIGIFDSGVGGLGIYLTVAKRAREINCPLSLFYFADTLRAPYGERSLEEIALYSSLALQSLSAMGVEAVALACNTAYVALAHKAQHVLDEQRVCHPISYAVNAVAINQECKRVAVISTKVTAASKVYSKRLLSLRPDIEIIEVPCPELVALVETGGISGSGALGVIKQSLAVLSDYSIDTLVLGCTHFSLISGSIQEVVGSGVQIIDGTTGMSDHLIRLLEENHKKQAADYLDERIILVTCNPSAFHGAAVKLAGGDIFTKIEVASLDPVNLSLKLVAEC